MRIASLVVAVLLVCVAGGCHAVGDREGAPGPPGLAIKSSR